MNRCRPSRTRPRGPLFLLAGVLVLGCCASAAQLRHRTTHREGDARILSHGIELELGTDGGQIWRQRLRTKIFTDHAIDRLGDPRVIHPNVQGAFKVLRAETTMRDGKVVAIKPNSINEATPSALVSVPAYANQVETIVTMVGMEVEAVTNLDYEVHSASTPGSLQASIPLQPPYPTDRLEVLLRVPGDRPPGVACLGCASEPDIDTSSADGHSELRARWQNLTAFNADDDRNMSSHGRHLNLPPAFGQPRLVVSTAGGWKALGEEFSLHFNRASTPTEVLRVRAQAICAGHTTAEQKLLALWRFVASDLATVYWFIADFGFRPAPAEQVLARSHGHSLDKAALLHALLEAVEIPSRPALISRDHLFALEVPTLHQFTKVWLQVTVDGVLRWVDPTRMRDGAGEDLLEGRLALIPGNDRPARIGAGTAIPHSTSSLRAELTIHDSGEVAGDFAIALTGSYSPFTATYADPEPRSVAKRVWSEVVGTDWSTACDGCYERVRQLSTDSSAVSYRAKRGPALEKGWLELILPTPANALLASVDLHRGDRQTPIALRWRGREIAEIEIQIPDRFTLRSPLPAATLKNAVGELKTTSQQTGSRIVIRRELTLTRRIVEPGDYADLKALAAILARAEQRSLLFLEHRPERTP